MEASLKQKYETDYKKIIKGKIQEPTKEELEEHIKKYLSSRLICSLATCSNNLPRSTVVRYRSKGLALYILTEGGKKIKNIKENPNVAISIYGDYTGFQSVNGLQIWGVAEIIVPEDREKYSEALDVLKTDEREDLKEMGAANMEIKMYALKINIKKARYLNLPGGIINKTLEIE